MMSSKKCQHPESNGGDCTFLNDRLQVSRKADSTSTLQQGSVCQTIYKSSPILVGLLMSNELEDFTGSSTSSSEKADALRFKINHPSAKEHVKQKGATVMVSSSCGPTRTKAQHPSAIHSGHFQPRDIFSMTVRDGLPSNTQIYRTNAQVLELINERVAFFRARRRKSDHNKTNSSSVPCHSTTASSGKKESTTHTFSCSLPKQASVVAGQTFEVDRLKGPCTNRKSTQTSDRNDNICALKQSGDAMASSVGGGPNEILHKSVTVCQTATNNQETTSLNKENISLNIKLSQCENVSKTGSVEQHWKHKVSQAAALSGGISPKHSEVTTTSSEVASNETIDTCVIVDVQFPERRSDRSKPVCSDYCDVQTLSSDRVNHKEVMNVVNVNPVAHSLSELRELVATLDSEATDAQVDNVSEVLLQQYWNGDRANVHAFESKEYPQIMLEVAATCTQLECPVTKTMFSPPSPCSSLPLEHQTSWINVKKDFPGGEPVCEGSSVSKHTAAEDQGNTSTKPGGVSTHQNGTNWSEAQHPGKQDTNANKQKSTKGLQSYKMTTMEANSNVKQNSSIDTISSVNTPLMDDNQEEQLLSHSCSHRGGETVRTDHGASSLDKNCAAVSVPNVPPYEDISDVEDPVQQPRERKESHFAAFFEDISDDEKLQTVNTFMETKTHPSEASPPKNTSLVQAESTSDRKVIPGLPQNCCCPYYIETVTGFEQVLCPKCDGQRLLRMQSPSNVLNKSDDEVDDWFVMPLKITDITVGDQVESDDGGQMGTPHQVTVSGSPLLAAQTTQPGSTSVIPPQEGPLEIELDLNHSNRRTSCESDDSCETEDSCDYVPTQGRNYLTASWQAWNNRESPSLPEQEGQGTPYPLNKETKEKSSTERNQSNVCSDSEDENDSTTRMIQKRKKDISPRSCGAGAASFLDGGGHSPESETETLPPEQLSPCPQELSLKSLAEDRIEVIPRSETDDCLDDADDKNTKKSSTSASDPGGDESAEEESVHQVRENPQTTSRVVLSEEESPEPPQSKNTRQNLKVTNAKVQLETNTQTATSKAKTNKLKRKARRPARIYSDSSETEDGEEACSDVADYLQVNKHKNISQQSGTKDGTHSVGQKKNSLRTPTRMSPEDKREKGHVNKKARRTGSSETEDSEDNFSNTPGGSTLQTQKRFPPKERPPGRPSDSGIVNRLCVQECPQSSECLQLSKDVPAQTPDADDQPHVNSNTPPATTKRTNWQTSHSKRDKEERASSKSKSFPASRAGTSALRKYLPATRQPSSHSHSSPTTPRPPRPFSSMSSGPPSARCSALDKVKEIWKDQFYPVPVNKKSSAVPVDNSKNEVKSARETDSGQSKVHRRKHGAKSETPLMKKTKSEAKERTRDIKSNQQRQHSCTVSDHYKWKDRREREPSGSCRRRTRCSSSPDLDWD